VLPLPLTPFEFYYWTDDRPEYPTTFPVDLQFSGTLDRDALTRALATVLERHPLLSAQIDESGPWPQWQRSPQHEPHIDWAAASVPIAGPCCPYIDLRIEPGLRVYVRAGDGTTRVVFHFHHACCDGLAGLRFVEDVLIAYGAQFVEKNPPALAPVDVTHLRDRGLFEAALGRRSFLVAVRDALITAREWSRILFGGAAVLAAPSGNPGGVATKSDSAPSDAATQSGFQTLAIPADRVRQLRRAATSLGATLNDLLLRDMFLVLRDWNRRHAGSLRGPVRLNVPVNLRGRDDKLMPAANRLGFAFVSLRKRDFAGADTALEAVNREMERIKTWKLGLYFLGGLQFAGKRTIRWTLRRNKSFATMVLSNLGRVYARTPLPRDGRRLICGDAVLERVSGVPPIRPLTRASVAVIDYGEETTINLNCDPHYFSADSSRALLDAYGEQLEESLRTGAATRTSEPVARE